MPFFFGLDEHEGGLDEHEGGLDEHEGGLDEHESGLDEHEGGLDEHEGTTKHIKNGFMYLCEGVTAILVITPHLFSHVCKSSRS